nr:unnamed protein product [Callosobruchus chinensis]
MRIHTGELPYKCSFCDVRTNTRGKLKVHERTHTGEKPFACSFCSKNFKQSIHLKEHLRTHTDERPFQCEFCNRAFRRLDTLQSHNRIHLGKFRKSSVADLRSFIPEFRDFFLSGVQAYFWEKIDVFF